MCSQVAGGGTCGARDGSRAYRWTDGEGGGDGGEKVKTGTCRRDGLGGEVVEIPLLLFMRWVACRFAVRVDGRCRRDSDSDNTDRGRPGLAHHAG